jgi:hypothetical protein
LEVVVVGGISEMQKINRSDMFRSRSKLNFICSSQFQKYLENKSELNQYLHNMSPLEVGNMVNGIEAAILNYYECRNVSTLMILLPQKPFLEIDKIRASEDIYPVLEQITCFKYIRPDMNFYHQMIRNDPYKLLSSNIYT